MSITASGLDSKAWLAALVDSSDDAIISKNLDGIITSWNRGAEEIFGYAAGDIVGRSILTLIPEDRHDEETYIINSIKAGKRIKQYNTIRRRKNGELIHVSLSVSPIYNDKNEIVGISKIARDISKQVLDQETQFLLLRELNHRSKNLLAVADAIVRQTAKSTPARELVGRISSRLQALSVNQDLMVNHQWRGVDLKQVISAQLEAIVDDHERRIHVSGPDCSLNPRVAQAVGLAIYELASNAQKFGSLTVPEGRVDLTWSFADTEDGRRFSMEWRESGGPVVRTPRRRGFGTTIIQRMVSQSVQGAATVHYLPDGLVWELTAAQSALSDHDGTELVSGPSGSPVPAR